MSGRGTPAIDALRRAGVAHVVHEYAHDPAATNVRVRDGRASWGLEAADALGVEPGRVFKTLLALVDDARLVVGIVPVAGELDLKGLAAAVDGRRAAMADATVAERATGYIVGGISPLGQRRRHPTVLDATALDHPTIYVSAGRRGLDLELAPADLARLTGAIVAPIGRLGQ
jgi:Cys-tRNA(Pro)/Cys-tRNA(Cys) deacylase